MDGKLFLGVADNNHFTLAVVGDSLGRIVATNVGGSVNHHFWGIQKARRNLREIITKTVGWQERQSLKGACFTYKSDLAVNDWEILNLVQGLLESTEILIEDFATSSTLGMHTEKDRLLLVGGQSGLVLFEDQAGQSHQMSHDPLSWNLNFRLKKRLARARQLEGCHELEHLLHKGSNSKNYASLVSLTKALNELVAQGNPLALEIASEVAHDLVRLVMNMAGHFNGLDPVIGLYGQVLLGSEVVCERVCHQINLLFPDARIAKAPLAPAKGAYLSSVLTRRSALEQEVITNLFTTASDLDQRGWSGFANKSSANGKNRH